MIIFSHIGRNYVLLGIFALVGVVLAETTEVPYFDAGPVRPEYVLITLSVFLLVMDLAKRQLKGRIHTVLSGIQTLGKWTLTGLFFNSLTVVFGLLAQSWARSQSINPIQSVFLPAFELLGLHGSKIFFLLLIIGVVIVIRDTLRVTDWSLIKDDQKYISARSYKTQMLWVLVLVGASISFWGLFTALSSVIVLTTMLWPLVISISIGALLHIASIVIRIFSRHSSKETSSDALWGLAFVIMALFGFSGVELAYSEGTSTAASQYVLMMVNMIKWLGVFFIFDTLIGAFSLQMYNTQQGWFVSGLGNETLLLRKLFRNSGKMFFLAYVLVQGGGPVSIMIDINFGTLAYAAYGLITAILVARVIELFYVSRNGLLLSGGIIWGGIGLFTAMMLVNLPAVIQVLGTIPNIANFSDSALPYALSISAASWWLVSGIAIVGFGKTARTLDIVSGRPGLPTMMAAIGFVLIGWSMWAVADAFTTLNPSFRIVGAVVLGITFGGALSLLATFFIEGTPSLISHPVNWLSSSRFRAMNIGGIVAAYLLVGRSVMFDVLAYAPLVEWIAVAFISIYITRRAWTLGRELGAPGNSTVPPADWVSHDQSIDFIEDDVSSRLINLNIDFIERGQRTALITRLTTVMLESGRSYEDIVKVVSQIFLDRPSKVSRRTRFTQRFSLRRDNDEISAYKQIRMEAFKVIGAVLESEPDRSVVNSFPSENELTKLITAGEKIFVESSDQTQLITTYCVAIWNQGIDRQSISNTLNTLAQYDDLAPPWYQIGPLERRWNNVAREIRARTVQDLRQTVPLGEIS